MYKYNHSHKVLFVIGIGPSKAQAFWRCCFFFFSYFLVLFVQLGFVVKFGDGFSVFVLSGNTHTHMEIEGCYNQHHHDYH